MYESRRKKAAKKQPNSATKDNHYFGSTGKQAPMSLPDTIPFCTNMDTDSLDENNIKKFVTPAGTIMVAQTTDCLSRSFSKTTPMSNHIHDKRSYNRSCCCTTITPPTAAKKRYRTFSYPDHYPPCQSNHNDLVYSRKYDSHRSSTAQKPTVLVQTDPSFHSKSSYDSAYILHYPLRHVCVPTFKQAFTRGISSMRHGGTKMNNEPEDPLIGFDGDTNYNLNLLVYSLDMNRMASERLLKESTEDFYLSKMTQHCAICQ